VDKEQNVFSRECNGYYLWTCTREYYKLIDQLYTRRCYKFNGEDIFVKTILQYL